MYVFRNRLFTTNSAKHYAAYSFLADCHLWNGILTAADSSDEKSIVYFLFTWTGLLNPKYEIRAGKNFFISQIISIFEVYLCIAKNRKTLLYMLKGTVSRDLKLNFDNILAKIYLHSWIRCLPARAGNLLIRSLLISLKSNELLWEIRSHRSRQMSDCEWIAQVTQDKWATISNSLRSLRGNEQMSDSLEKFWQKILFFSLSYIQFLV